VRAFRAGQEFVVSAEKPWPCARVLRVGVGRYPEDSVGMSRGGPNLFVSCCTDGFRPVIFKLEKVKRGKGDFPRAVLTNIVQI